MGVPKLIIYTYMYDIKTKNKKRRGSTRSLDQIIGIVSTQRGGGVDKNYPSCALSLVIIAGFIIKATQDNFCKILEYGA